jgi:glutamate-5-semialdehyde dehydrogenase
MNLNTVFKRVSKASRKLSLLSPDVINNTILSLAGETEKKVEMILDGNRKDLDLMDKNDPKYDRLMLTAERLKGIVSDLKNVTRLPNPLGRILSQVTRPNGLKITRISVPFGVIGVIYESRPNVTFDVFSLCLKSGNACILKGGSDAINSNLAITSVIRDVLQKQGIDPDILTLLPAGRSETHQLLNAGSYVDLIIPRGSRELIDFVRENSSIPVIETGAGICHTYFDESGDLEKGRSVINNAKTRRVSVCNALDCLIIHSKRLTDLSYLVELCAGSKVEIFADTRSFRALEGRYPSGLLHHADRDSFGTEFLSYKMAVKTVDSLDAALTHIGKYGSKHSEAIISQDRGNIELFFRIVDASSVYSNTSTAFTDGAEFGLGAEIGISTQKLHARGPMALEALTTYKWIIEGDGQIRG